MFILTATDHQINNQFELSAYQMIERLQLMTLIITLFRNDQSVCISVTCLGEIQSGNLCTNLMMFLELKCDVVIKTRDVINDT